MQKHGDQHAFLEIYERYHAGLYAAAAKRCQCAEAAEEIVQDLFITLWKKREKIVVQLSLSGYLYTSIRNLVINHLQYEALRKGIRGNSELKDEYYDNSLEESLVARDLHSYIKQQVKLLPIKCRSVFELSRFEHKSNKQIASELGLTEKTVENHISRAIKYLRIGLQQLVIILPFIKLK